jgi:hypothetical protein
MIKKLNLNSKDEGSQCLLDTTDNLADIDLTALLLILVVEVFGLSGSLSLLLPSNSPTIVEG